LWEGNVGREKTSADQVVSVDRSPTPGAFLIALHYKGREKAILEMDLKIDDLLEKQKDGVALLDLEYVSLNVPKVLTLLNK